MSARTMVSSICFGDDTTPVAQRPSSRVNQPGGTGGRSNVFDDTPDPSPQRPTRAPEPSPLIDTGDASPAKVHTRVMQPGGTGGASKVFDEPESPTFSGGKYVAPTAGERAPAPYAREGEEVAVAQEPAAISTRVLQPGGTGGKSKVFDEDEEEIVRSTRRINVNEPSKASLEDDEERRLASRKATAQQRAGGGPSKVFDIGDADDDKSRGFSGRKVEPGRTNMSQVALGGGYPDAEPSKRNGRRGNIRSDYNSSQIAFGDDTDGKPVPDRDPQRTSSKVLRPGGTGGSSQIAFGDDTNGKVVEKAAGVGGGSGTARTSSRVLKPGGTGGSSQITF